jgi:hypothetical protein
MEKLCRGKYSCLLFVFVGDEGKKLNAIEISFPATNDATGQTISVSVFDYFKTAYKINIKYPN